MGRYSAFVGKRVQAYYRAADIHLSAAGTLVSDSGKPSSWKTIFLRAKKKKPSVWKSLTSL